MHMCSAHSQTHKARAQTLHAVTHRMHMRTPVQARELKSVHVNVPAYYIRLVVQRCHVNKLNIYNQVHASMSVCARACVCV